MSLSRSSSASEEEDIAPDADGCTLNNTPSTPPPIADRINYLAGKLDRRSGRELVISHRTLSLSLSLSCLSSPPTRARTSLFSHRGNRLTQLHKDIDREKVRYNLRKDPTPFLSCDDAEHLASTVAVCIMNFSRNRLKKGLHFTSFGD